MLDFKLPDLGEGVAEAEIDRWHVEEGDAIGEDQALVDVITDKATAEIPSPYAGIVSKIHYRPGDTAPVGAVLVSIAAASDSGVTGAASPDAVPAGGVTHAAPPNASAGLPG
ncbi:MAG: 2-oxo acid dehydrogenase subunit E2, partial [Actinobacteria bacterium]|nr:2-oxo acid dehydrogenase subunit E2 [Actinomycetota bacterium]